MNTGYYERIDEYRYPTSHASGAWVPDEQHTAALEMLCGSWYPPLVACVSHAPVAAPCGLGRVF